MKHFYINKKLSGLKIKLIKLGLINKWSCTSVINPRIIWDSLSITTMQEDGVFTTYMKHWDYFHYKGVGITHYNNFHFGFIKDKYNYKSKIVLGKELNKLLLETML